MRGVSPDPLAVLIVDDHAMARAAARQVVEAAEGFAVAGQVHSGEAALEAVPRLEPDLVLMDARMPGLDGLETTRRLAARQPSLVIFLTSTDDLDTDLALSAGAAAFVRKQKLSPRRLRELWDECADAEREDDVA
jgi:DNA-binding NarL/FixJ family response regulator